MTQVTSRVLTIAELLTMGRFVVPWHQRHYDWTTEQVHELLVDLNEAIDEGRNSYFLGSIMLVDADPDTWEINDGQQRLITLALLIAALCRRFARRRESDAAHEQAALNLLFARDAAAVTDLDSTAVERPRIEPPRLDSSRFRQIVRGHEIGTNGKMTSAWNEIETVLMGLTVESEKRLFDFVAKNVEIAVLYVPPSEDANAVFEALNGRGKQLDDVDLIRNHLYSYFTGSEDVERRTTVHDSLESVLVTNRTQERSQQYFRCYFQCRFGYLQKNRFYRETRARVRAERPGSRTSEVVYDLVRDLSDSRFVELFRTITTTPNEELKKAFLRASRTTRTKRNLPVLLRELKRYAVVRPLVFALLRRFIEAQAADQEEGRQVAKVVHRSLSDLDSFVMRVALSETKFEPSRFEAAFANIAKRIGSEQQVDRLAIQDELREHDEREVMHDRRFVLRLSEVRIKDARRLKELLFGINAAADREASLLDIRGCTVEHVWPQSPAHRRGWEGFADITSDADDWVYRIGNLTLLGDGQGFAGGAFNANFEAKRAVYRESPIAMTRELAEMDDWTPATIQARSRKLAKAACRVWSFYGS